MFKIRTFNNISIKGLSRLPSDHYEVGDNSVDADAFRATVLARYNMSLGNGLGRLAGRVFRIGHLGDFNELMLIGTLGGVEMGLAASGITHQRGGVTAAMDYLSG